MKFKKAAVLSVLSIPALVSAGGLRSRRAAQQNGGGVFRTHNPRLIHASENPIANQYIVVLDPACATSDNIDVKAQGLINSVGAGAKMRGKGTWKKLGSFKGFAANMTPGQAEAMSRNSCVSYVEQDAKVHIDETQSNPPWGLDRVDQESLPLDDTFGYNHDGTGVTEYILDTGIRTTHEDFEGRASWGDNFTGDDTNYDCHGHGTHVAGTVGGLGCGVAKGVQLIAVKVLDCGGSGSYSGIIDGINWVTSHDNGGQKKVANMSLRGGKSTSLNNAVQNSVAAGVVHVVAAGNDNSNACNYSPASAPAAITVGSTTNSDARSSFSNFRNLQSNSCVDIFAPGSSVYSASATSDYSYTFKSGTSMASPHVAGAVAQILEENSSLTPSGVTSVLLARATPDVITGIPSNTAPNLLLYTLGSTASTCDPACSGMTPFCDGGTCVECLSADDCPDDGIFCNGTPTCDAYGICQQAGADPCSGTTPLCNEIESRCDCEGISCDNGIFCDGAETCDGGTCIQGNDPCLPGETCDEDTKDCITCSGKGESCRSTLDCCRGKCNKGICRGN